MGSAQDMINSIRYNASLRKNRTVKYKNKLSLYKSGLRSGDQMNPLFQLASKDVKWKNKEKLQKIIQRKRLLDGLVIVSCIVLFLLFMHFYISF